MYTFINLNENKGYTCSDDMWISILTIAQSNGWEPKGTWYDITFLFDEIIDENDDILETIFNIISINNTRLEWKGSYTEKSDQIVKQADAENMYRALKMSGINPELIAFIKKGSFRIRSE